MTEIMKVFKVWLIQSCLTLCSPIAYSPPRLLCPWNFPGKNTGVGCHFLLQAIFQTQELNMCLMCLLHWQAGSLPLVSPEKPLIAEIIFSHFRISRT